MRITDVKTILLTGPCTDDPFMADFLPLRSAAFIEVHTDTPHIGIGETYLGYVIPEIVPTLVDFFKSILVGAETFDIYILRQRLLDSCVYWGRVGVGPAVISGIEAALWDLKGKLLNVPVYELLGGKCHDRLQAYATGGPSLWPMDRLLAKLDFYLELGFRAVKVGAGYFNERTGQADGETEPTAAADLEAKKAETMRRHVGEDIRLLMDGHMGFKQGPERWTVQTATEVLRALEPYGIFFFEEPLPYSDPKGYGELRAATTVPIAGGESLTTIEEFRQFAEHDGFAVAQPDAAWVGGLSEFIDVGRLFATRGRWVASHAWGAGAAVMQNLHAAFATPNTIIVEIPPAAGPLHREVWGDAIQLHDGAVLPPGGPGLGVTLSDAVKEKYPFVPGTGEFVDVPGKTMRRQHNVS
jgi:L-alanine-DL-glutamate epimerase-like enolase superfamily enzyme